MAENYVSEARQTPEKTPFELKTLEEITQAFFVEEKPVAPLEIAEKTPDKPAPAKITDRQMRALSKKHLFMMIRDLEAELQREKGEKENLLQAYRAGIVRKKSG